MTDDDIVRHWLGCSSRLEFYPMWKGETSIMKFARMGSRWFRQGRNGWEDCLTGKVEVLSASPKKVQFFANEEDAKLAGYVPSSKVGVIPSKEKTVS